MNLKKAQKDVFNRILNGEKIGYFNIDENNVFVSAGSGSMGYIFPADKIRFSFDGLCKIPPFPIKELIKQENHMAVTESYKKTAHGMCQWMKHKNGNYALVQCKFLSCFANTEFYSEGDHVSIIVSAEKGKPIGVICPIRSNDISNSGLMEAEE